MMQKRDRLADPSLDLPRDRPEQEPGAPFGPELEYWEGGAEVVIGVDEAGRGPLAGPVVAAAVAFSPGVRLAGIGDSKQIGEVARAALCEPIRQSALSHAVAAVDQEEIDQINILQATWKAMDLAVAQVAEKLGCDWPVLLVDGRIPRLSRGRHVNLIRGDVRSFSIGAASILAKVHRDRYMEQQDTGFPEYGFAKHKGYGTQFHRQKIEELGPVALHRKSFQITLSTGQRMPIGEVKGRGR